MLGGIRDGNLNFEKNFQLLYRKFFFHPPFTSRVSMLKANFLNLFGKKIQFIKENY